MRRNLLIGAIILVLLLPLSGLGKSLPLPPGTDIRHEELTDGQPFRDGCALVMIDTHTYCIDTAGKVVFSLP